MKCILSACSIFIITYLMTGTVYAVACDPPQTGDYTLPQSCTFDNNALSIHGVRKGNLIVPDGVTLTINAGQTIFWHPGYSIQLAGGTIAMNESAEMKQGDVNEEYLRMLGFDAYAAALPVRVFSNNLHVCTSEPCTATAPNGSGHLVVEGKVKITGGNPGADKILTSDATGVASWAAASGLVGGYLHDTHRKNVSTDTTVASQVVRKGWGYIAMTGQPAGYWGAVYGNVTYGITFDDIPIVIFHGSGFKPSAPAPTSLSQCVNHDVRTQVAFAITASQFSYKLSGASQTDGVTGYACFTWVAIGTYAAGY